MMNRKFASAFVEHTEREAGLLGAGIADAEGGQEMRDDRQEDDLD